MRALVGLSTTAAVLTGSKTFIRTLSVSHRSALPQSWYWDTVPPTPQDLAVAKWFFNEHPPKKLWTAIEWRKNNEDSDQLRIPEVAFFGRSNVGKSSLLNAVLNSPGLNHVGSKPGKTKILHAWGLSATNDEGGARKGWKGQIDTRLAVLDAPGYGYGSQTGWGEEVVTYLKRRRQLKRVFVLLDPGHGIKKHDLQLINLLRNNKIAHQLIASKVDRQKSADLQLALQNMRNIATAPASRDAMPALGELLLCGALDSPVSAQGVDAVQWAILRATGLDDFAYRNYMRMVKGVENITERSGDATSSTLQHSQTLPPPLMNNSEGQAVLNDFGDVDPATDLSGTAMERENIHSSDDAFSVPDKIATSSRPVKTPPKSSPKRSSPSTKSNKSTDIGAEIPAVDLRQSVHSGADALFAISKLASGSEKKSPNIWTKRAAQAWTNRRRKKKND